MLRKNRNVMVDIQDPLGNIGFLLMNHCSRRSTTCGRGAQS